MKGKTVCEARRILNIFADRDLNVLEPPIEGIISGGGIVDSRGDRWIKVGE